MKCILIILEGIVVLNAVGFIYFANHFGKVVSNHAEYMRATFGEDSYKSVLADLITVSLTIEYKVFTGRHKALKKLAPVCFVSFLLYYWTKADCVCAIIDCQLRLIKCLEAMTKEDGSGFITCLEAIRKEQNDGN